MIAGAVLGAIALLFHSARRATTVCVLEATDGVLRVRSGALSPRILGDLSDVAARPKVKRGAIRIVRRSGRAEVSISGGFSEAQAQQVRNVVGSVPLVRLMNVRDSRGL